jgi:hypothetical protein
LMTSLKVFFRPEVVQHGFIYSGCIGDGLRFELQRILLAANSSVAAKNSLLGVLGSFSPALSCQAKS